MRESHNALKNKTKFKIMFKSGDFTKKHVERTGKSEISDEQIKPHGVELTVDKIHSCRNYSVLADEGHTNATRKEAHLVDSGKYVDKSNSVNHRRKDIREVDDEEYKSEESLFDNNHYVELDRPHYVLIRGAYVVSYNEEINVPEGHIGFLWPRTGLVQSGNFLSAPVWDSHYSGNGEGGLHINCMTFIEKDMRLGQFVLAETHTAEKYIEEE
jgi:Deoxycytidine deaminase